MSYSVVYDTYICDTILINKISFKTLFRFYSKNVQKIENFRFNGQYLYTPFFKLHS